MTEAAPVPLLEAEGLTIRGGRRLLVRDLDFRIFPGEHWCILGPNGAGKTTLLHTLMGMRQPQGGTVKMRGKGLGEWLLEEAARQRSFLPQTLHDAFSSTALETVLMARHPHLARWQWEGDGDRDIARAALATVELDGMEQRDVLTLSGGERQRVALAALFAQEAPLMLLDEPVSSLDLHHQVMVLEHLSGLARERATGVLFTVHDLGLAARFASHAMLLMPGGSVVQGRIEEVMAEDGLSTAFGHRVTRAVVSGRVLFVPA